MTAALSEYHHAEPIARSLRRLSSRCGQRPVSRSSASRRPGPSIGQTAPDFGAVGCAGQTGTPERLPRPPRGAGMDQPGLPLCAASITAAAICRPCRTRPGARGVVWLTINSTADRQRRLPDTRRRLAALDGRADRRTPSATLMDESGELGRAMARAQRPAHVHRQPARRAASTPAASTASLRRRPKTSGPPPTTCARA